MLRGIITVIVLFMVTGIVSGLQVQQYSPDRQEINENESAIWSFRITNDEFEPVDIDVDFGETMFPIDGYPFQCTLNPGEDIDGYYLIGPCKDITEDVEFESFYNVTDEGQWSGDRSTIGNPVTLNVSAGSNEEPVFRIVEREEPYPVEIVVVSIVIFFLLLLKRHLLFSLIPPLYNKIYGEGLFSNEWRNKIYIALENEKEGLRMRDIASCTGCNRDTARYHVRRLVKDGYVIQKPNKKYYHYMNNNNNVQSLETTVRQMMNDHPEIKQVEIANQLGISRQHAYYYMKKINNGHE